MKIKAFLFSVTCALLLSASGRIAEVVYQAPIEGLSLDTRLYTQVVPDGYIVVGNTEVARLDDRHQIAWQFKPRSKGQHGITTFCYDGDGGLILGGWEKGKHGKQAWLVSVNGSGQTVWDKPIQGSENVLAITGSPKTGFYVLSVDGTARRVRYYDRSGNLKQGPSIEVTTDFSDDVRMFIRSDSTVTIFGGTASNSLAAERLGLGKASTLREKFIIEREAFYKKLKGFVNFIVIENPAGGYYAAYTAIGGEKNSEDYRLVTLNDKLKSLSTKDFGGDDSDGLSSLGMDKAGNLVLAGYSYSGVSRDKSEPAFEKNHCDVWVIKVDANGTRIWDKTLTGPGCILQARVFTKGDQTWVVYGEENQVMVATLRD